LHGAVALGAIAWKLIEAGAPSRALRVLAKARQACEDMQDGAVWEAVYAFAWIGHLFAQAGARQEAIAEWIRAADLAQAHQELAFKCGEVLEHVACGLAGTGVHRPILMDRPSIGVDLAPKREPGLDGSTERTDVRGERAQGGGGIRGV
jgi:hypothetical protein